MYTKTVSRNTIFVNIYNRIIMKLWFDIDCFVSRLNSGYLSVRKRDVQHKHTCTWTWIIMLSSWSGHVERWREQQTRNITLKKMLMVTLVKRIQLKRYEIESIYIFLFISLCVFYSLFGPELKQLQRLMFKRHKLTVIYKQNPISK